MNTQTLTTRQNDERETRLQPGTRAQRRMVHSVGEIEKVHKGDKTAYSLLRSKGHKHQGNGKYVSLEQGVLNLPDAMTL